jgi:hypothetical protein
MIRSPLLELAGDETMRLRAKLIVGAMLATTLMLGVGPVPPQAKDPGVAPPDSNAYGKSLQDWLTVYWTWYSDGKLPDTNHVYLMPLPQGIYDIGSGSYEDPAIMNGHLDISLKPGTPFVLPIQAWIGEIYEDPTKPADVPVPDEWYGVYITADVTLDGRPILENFMDYYVPATYFDEPVTYPGGPTPWGSIAAIFFQGVGFVGAPLSPGKHTITNDVYFMFPPEVWGNEDGYGSIYHNSWTITVK